MNDLYLSKVYKLSMFMLIVCIVALLFMPILPWTSSSTEGVDKTTWSYEGMILDSGEQIEDDLDDYKDMYGTKSDTYKSAKEQLNAKNNLGGIGFYYWMSLLFIIIIFVGIGLYSMGQKYQLFGNIIFLLSIMILIFSILIILNHVWFMGSTGELSDLAGKDTDYAFSFNYIPMIMGIILLILSIIFIVNVAPVAIGSITANSQRNRARYYQQQPGYQQPQQQTPPPPPSAGQPQQQPPQQQPPQQQQQTPPPNKEQSKKAGSKFCPKCGTKITGSPKFCTNCGNSLK